VTDQFVNLLLEVLLLYLHRLPHRSGLLRRIVLHRSPLLARIRKGEARGPLALGRKQRGIGVAFLLDREVLRSRERMSLMRWVGRGLRLRKRVCSLSTEVGLGVGRLAGVVGKRLHVALSLRGRWVVRVPLSRWKSLTRTGLAEDVNGLSLSRASVASE
jgi:hypothetical protein